MSNYQFNPLQVAIKPFYEQAIAEDELFAKEVKEKESRKEKPKSLAECAEYIMGEAYRYAEEHKQGNFGLAGIPDEEMPGLIKHYYDEDDIEIYKVSNAKAVVQKTGGKAKPEKPKKPEKPVRPKENLNCINVPMIRPESEKDAKRASREQAKSVIVMDLFGGLTADEDDLPED